MGNDATPKLRNKNMPQAILNFDLRIECRQQSPMLPAFQPKMFAMEHAQRVNLFMVYHAVVRYEYARTGQTMRTRLLKLLLLRVVNAHVLLRS